MILLTGGDIFFFFLPEIYFTLHPPDSGLASSPLSSHLVYSRSSMRQPAFRESSCSLYQLIQPSSPVQALKCTALFVSLGCLQTFHGAPQFIKKVLFTFTFGMSKSIFWPFEKTAKRGQNTENGKINIGILHSHYFSIRNDKEQNFSLSQTLFF